MARSFTLAQIRSRVRQLADIEDSTFISDSEVNSYISESYAELYDLLLSSGLSYFESSDSITGTGSATYSLPADYYGTVRIDRDAGDYLVPLRPIGPNEVPNFSEASNQFAVAYRVVGSNVTLYPPPSSGTYKHLYIPAPDDLDVDTETVDGVSGWEQYVIYDAAIKCMEKEESAPAHLSARLDRIKMRIEEAAQNRMWGDTTTIAETAEGDDWLNGDYFYYR